MRKSTVASPSLPTEKLIFETASTVAVLGLNSLNFRQQIWEQLYALPYGAFLVVVAHVLQKQGSKNIQILNRRGFVGRNRSGGWDMEATLPNQFSHSEKQNGTRCIIQVKQFKDLAVQQRTVDELRGCCLRAGVGMGVLITTSRFSAVARAAAQSSPLAPVGLIDGEQFLTLLVDQKLGVRQDQDGKWEIDDEFFAALASAPTGSYEKAAPKTEQVAARTAVSISIMVEAVPFHAGKGPSHQCISKTTKKIKIMNL